MSLVSFCIIFLCISLKTFFINSNDIEEVDIKVLTDKPVFGIHCLKKHLAGGFFERCFFHMFSLSKFVIFILGTPQ